jgi:hypothetical protein
LRTISHLHTTSKCQLAQWNILEPVRQHCSRTVRGDAWQHQAPCCDVSQNSVTIQPYTDTACAWTGS